MRHREREREESERESEDGAEREREEGVCLNVNGMVFFLSIVDSG